MNNCLLNGKIKYRILDFFHYYILFAWAKEYFSQCPGNHCILHNKNDIWKTAEEKELIMAGKHENHIGEVSGSETLKILEK